MTTDAAGPADGSGNARLAGERAQLDAFLDEGRAEILEALAGLDDEQARRRLVPSLTSPLSLLKHLVFVERNWFDVNVAGRTRAEAGIVEDSQESWVLGDQDTLAGLLDDYRRACADSRETGAAYDLEHTVVHRFFGEVSLRWVLLHMIRETARHAGHADILREQVLAAES